MLVESEHFELTLSVNQEHRSISVPARKRLLDILREDLGLTGTKEGCGEGECGACTVSIDGELACSCLIPAFQLQGCEVLTIESVAKNNTLSTVQTQLARCGGTQCGICTPGIVMACENILKDKTITSTHQIQEALAGNLCRCTGYTKIIEAVLGSIKIQSELP